MSTDVQTRAVTHQLRELAADMPVQQSVYPEVPPKVEYCVTETASVLEPLRDALRVA